MLAYFASLQEFFKSKEPGALSSESYRKINASIQDPRKVVDYKVQLRGTPSLQTK